MTDAVRLRPAYPSDRAAMTALWQQVFGDSEATITGFYEAFPRCRAAVAENEVGALVSIVHVLPQTLTVEDQTIPAAYLYAVATRPDYRGRGLASTLIRFTEALLERLDYRCAVLVPAEPSLFSYYARLGYTTAFLRNHTPFPGGREIGWEEYHQRREALLTEPHITYSPEYYAYLQQAYGVNFYETQTGIAAAAGDYTAEVLPQDLGGTPCAMLKWLGRPRTLPSGYLGFALE